MLSGVSQPIYIAYPFQEVRIKNRSDFTDVGLETALP
jgi:hypothetical protein